MTELTEQDKRRLAKLDALEAGGVDNWEWYGDSIEGFDIPEYVSSELAKIKE